ncbi:MAG TPA: deoxyribose-phosphate aldolase [Planctomycetaceae bacterium]|jgi:deoxyribose-phosphate aldolase|nr:deoxyribose-phosphate aldolase [Rhodopirellula sp.]MCH2360744.1 deoxyribose-phosphate aldolase [Pirellulales bacterium]HAL14834.1 deoxyribose-phosphate aldolase [Planctomycetaceae bacterium]HCK72976.1 deoxyribose-phosphate aldolase [Planctomycetaceae bacterium]|tara:strand:- start:665 stop:1387 length:723 start_codon:yes stop_codon:yes gene_type:complete
MQYSYQEIAKMIDHALLSPSLTADDMESGIKMAMLYDVASVCIMPSYLERCARLLEGTTVMPSTVIGFPLGGHASSTKIAEAERAINDGCQELDMVVNISQVLSGRWESVESDIAGVIELAHAADRRVKVIFENCYLTDEHKIRLCEICNELNADWVKTSTGFGTGGATVEDVKLMRRTAAEHVQVKAAGGVRSLASLIEMKELGATRCGASATKTILDECREQLGLEPIGFDGGETAGY